MEYNSRKIGNRIKAEMKKRGWTQEYLASQLGMTRQTLSKILNGMYEGNSYSVGILLELCKLFDCEMGYLLCEYDNPTRESTDISQALGLSANAIDKIKDLDKVTLALFEALLDSTDLVKQIIGQLQTIIARDNDIQSASPIWLHVDSEKLMNLYAFQEIDSMYRDSAMYRVHQIAEDLVYTLFLNPKFFNTICAEYDTERLTKGMEEMDIDIERNKKFASLHSDYETMYQKEEQKCIDLKEDLEYVLSEEIGSWNYWSSLRLDKDNPLGKYCPDSDKYCTEDERPNYL